MATYELQPKRSHHTPTRAQILAIVYACTSITEAIKEWQQPQAKSVRDIGSQDYIHKMVKSIKFNCVICKRIDKEITGQVMGKLPEERLKPAPPWSSTAIDLFGPFKIRDEVRKRTIGKAFGVLFDCLATRAAHVDLSPDYSVEKFLMVLRRFVSVRGYPAKLRITVTRSWNCMGKN